VKNLEEKRGKPARIVLGEPLPDKVEILPSPVRLEARTQPILGDLGYLDALDAAHANSHVTDGELRQARDAHLAVALARDARAKVEA
jgi:hypothetical protein